MKTTTPKRRTPDHHPLAVADDRAAISAADPDAALDAIGEITALNARHFRTLDQQDWEGYRSVFTTDVEIGGVQVFPPAD